MNKKMMESLRQQIELMDENTMNRMLEETKSMLHPEEWEQEIRMFNYMHRWMCKGVALPSSIRMRIAKWTLPCSAFKPIYDACITNDLKPLEVTP